MTIEQNVISKIGTLPQKRICIIGTMSEKFYILLAKNLMPNDCVCIFDTTGNISKAEASLNNAMYSNIEIMAFPVSNKKFDWYGWRLFQYYHQLRKLGVPTQVFTAVFYKGKHLFQYDMGTLQLVKDMLTDGGYFVVYDCVWTLAKSPTMNPQVNADTAAEYTKEQINIPHIQYLLDGYIDNTFMEQEELSSAKTRVYRKRQPVSSAPSNLYY